MGCSGAIRSTKTRQVRGISQDPEKVWHPSSHIGIFLIGMTAREEEQSVNAFVGRNLAVVRTTAGLTQTEAASLLNTTQATVSRWESGSRSPSLQQLYFIGAAYGVSTSSLIPDIDPSMLEGDTDGTAL